MLATAGTSNIQTRHEPRGGLGPRRYFGVFGSQQSKMGGLLALRRANGKPERPSSAAPAPHSKVHVQKCASSVNPNRLDLASPPKPQVKYPDALVHTNMEYLLLDDRSVHVGSGLFGFALTSPYHNAPDHLHQTVVTPVSPRLIILLPSHTTSDSLSLFSSPDLLFFFTCLDLQIAVFPIRALDFSRSILYSRCSLSALPTLPVASLRPYVSAGHALSRPPCRIRSHLAAARQIALLSHHPLEHLVVL